MSEFVHSTGVKSERPSIFELSAADHLQRSLFPAVQHLRQAGVRCGPSSGLLRFILSYCDEVYTLCISLLQYHYLRKSGGCLSESFYGLTRRSARTGVVPRAAIMRALVVSCLLPYFHRRLQNLLDTWSEQLEDTRQSSKKGRVSVKLFLTRVYPVVCFVVNLITVSCTLLYILGHGKYHSVSTLFCGAELRYLTERECLELESSRTSLLTTLRRGGLRPALVVLVTSTLPDIVSRSVEMSAFFMQFLDWWYNEEESIHVQAPVEPPPPPDLTSSKQRISSFPSGVCPLCRTSFDHSSQIAVLAVSGHVFCYYCIMEFVMEKGKCPLSGYRACTDQVYRLQMSGLHVSA